MIYIQHDLNNFINLSYQLGDNYLIGTTWEDYLAGKWILLTDEQIQFKESNPEASIEEVFNMQLNIPSEEELLENAKTAKRNELNNFYNSKLHTITYNEKDCYLDYLKRLEISSKASTAKRQGNDSITFNEITIPVDLIEHLLDKVSNFESECNSSLSDKYDQINQCGLVNEVEAIVVEDNFPTSPTLDESKLKEQKKNSESNIAELQVTTFIKNQINSIELTDAQSLAVKLLYPNWEEFIGKSLSTGMKVLYNKKLFKVIQEVPVVLENQYPDITTAALYTEINETHEGTLEDPIPYNLNMELENGKYYSQYGVIYLCTRDTEIPVYVDLSGLVGIYVEIVS